MSWKHTWNARLSATPDVRARRASRDPVEHHPRGPDSARRAKIPAPMDVLPATLFKLALPLATIAAVLLCFRWRGLP